MRRFSIFPDADRHTVHAGGSAGVLRRSAQGAPDLRRELCRYRDGADDGPRERRRENRASNSLTSHEQIFQPTGRRSKILVRHPDLSPKVSGSVPRPARVKQRRPSERDKVGVSRGENGFGLLEFSDHADGDDGQRRRLLKGPRERNLIAGADRNLLSRAQTAARDVDRGAASSLQRFDSTRAIAPSHSSE